MPTETKIRLIGTVEAVSERYGGFIHIRTGNGPSHLAWRRDCEGNRCPPQGSRVEFTPIGRRPSAIEVTVLKER